MAQPQKRKKTEIKGYNGNNLLKRTGVQIEWTPEMVNEYTHCATDIKYFIENYIKIITLDDGKTKFILRDYQENIIDTFEQEQRVILMLPRQSGKCLSEGTTITIRNKKTGIVETIPIIELYKKHKI